jgi:16S rRNA C967 or C1407 C5-methylase (RsmB/RsmF family)
MEAPRLLQKFSQKLFDPTNDPTNQARFIAALTEPQPFHPCILWLEEQDSPFTLAAPVGWQPDFVERLELGEKPGQHPLHQQGKFYCLDFSSVFAASVLLMIKSRVRVALDVCASPGGKSIFAWRALQPQQLLCDEVIGKRLGALLSNLKRCHVPATAFSLDSSILAVELAQTADLVLVDAPCTGQSLLAKGEKNPGCFHPVTINKNANRQKRILANSAQTVAAGGYLVYMTCAYSLEENEQVVTWLLQKFPQFQPVEVPYLQSYQSQLTNLPCYRMFPQDGLGAGAFTVLLRNGQGGSVTPEAEARLAAFLQRPKLIRLEGDSLD